MTSLAFMNGYLATNYPYGSTEQQQGNLKKSEQDHGYVVPFGQATGDDIRKLEARENPDDSKYYEEQDRRAQKSAADAAQVMVFLTEVSIILGLVGAGAIIWTLAVSRESNSISRETAERQLRAYIHVTSVKLEHANDDFAPTITVNYKNFGQTPARNVINHLSVSFVIMGEAKGGKRKVSDERGYDLGPSQDSSTSSHVSFDTGFSSREMLVDNLVKLYVIGEITYKDVFGLQDRYTRYKMVLHPEPDAVIDTDAFMICHDGNEAN
ncbi:hypothetical protein CK222_21955 [Mesorhizobium sp. WSM3866]|nr:hypothetical protein CK222_21955 [Mesorhizobium sp. WSM3866]